MLATHSYCSQRPDRCLEVRYEDLVRAPVEELTRLCDFLQVPFHGQMTQLARSVENVGDARGKAHIVNGNVGKYARWLTRREQAAVESLAWNAMRACGYEPEFATGQSHLGRASLAWRRLKDGVLLFKHDATRLGPMEAVRFHAQHRRVSRA